MSKTITTEERGGGVKDKKLQYRAVRDNYIGRLVPSNPLSELVLPDFIIYRYTQTVVIQDRNITKLIPQKSGNYIPMLTARQVTSAERR